MAGRDMRRAMPLLEGKLALITGGARGIGLAVAQAMGKSGARLILVDSGCERDGSNPDPSVVEQSAKGLRELGLSVEAHAFDVADEERVQALFRDLETSGQVPDILVNAAGIIRDRSLLNLSATDFDAVLRTHVRGTFLFIQAFASLLRTQKRGGSILNMTSVAGLLGNVQQANESAAKAAIYGLTRTASIELQKYGITVNALAAIARTRLTEDLPMFEKLSGTMEPEHVAPAALYLTSHLSDGLSGTVLSVAGGRIARIGLVESTGRTKHEDGGLWTPEEIRDHFEGISKI
jgi:NAD(P)-dependent dehydrogenase (short-subunit alcohol dehydrogenase family)